MKHAYLYLFLITATMQAMNIQICHIKTLDVRQVTTVKSLRERIEVAIENKQDLNEVFNINGSPYTLLSLASSSDECNDCVSALLALGAKLNTANAIFKAVQHNAVSNTELLLNHFTPEDYDWYGNFPLFAAIDNNAIDCFKLLIEKGLDLNRFNKTHNKTPLMQIIKQLQLAEKNKDIHFFSTWHSLAVDLIKQKKILLDENNQGETAFDLAEKAGLTRLANKIKKYSKNTSR